MAARSMNEILKSRMTATRQASELEASDEAYQIIFQEAPPSAKASIRELPLEQLIPFFTADIGFRPYSPEKLRAFADQLQEEGLLVRIIVRPMGQADRYEILAGHNRVNAAKLAGWQTIPAEVVEADDVRAIVIATSTNLIQRQGLSIIERGKAYKALIVAKNRQGYRSDRTEATSGENRQKYSARSLVAEFFGVSEYEIRKLIKLTYLIPELLDILEQNRNGSISPAPTSSQTMTRIRNRLLWRYVPLRGISSIKPLYSTSSEPVHPQLRTGSRFSPHGGRRGQSRKSVSPRRQRRFPSTEKDSRHTLRNLKARQNWKNFSWNSCDRGLPETETAGLVLWLSKLHMQRGSTLEI